MVWQNSRKKALYEVIGKSRKRPEPAKTTAKPKSEPKEPGKGALSGRGTWPAKPPIVQYVRGRFEISLPYQLAVVLAMVLILAALVIFRLGQRSGADVPADIAGQGGVSGESAGTETTAGQTRMQMPLADEDSLEPGPRETAEPGQGGNRIVIQSYRGQDDLVPVQRFFGQHGIQTRIVREGSWYYLVTERTFNHNPERVGTAGYDKLQRIRQLGGQYEAPPGYETFGSRPFHDAYGKRFTND